MVELGVRGRSVFESGMTPRIPLAYNDRSKLAISIVSTLCGSSAKRGNKKILNLAYQYRRHQLGT